MTERTSDHSVLMVIDIQNDFCHEEGLMAKIGKNVKPLQAIVPRINWLIKKLKEVNVPIIFVTILHNKMTISPSWGKRRIFSENIICKEGSWGAEIYKLDVQLADYVIIKHRYSAFFGTDLDLILRSINCSKVMVSGVTTNVCVESTIRDAISYNYLTYLVKDCTAAFTKKEYLSGLYNIEQYFGFVTDSQEIVNTI